MRVGLNLLHAIPDVGGSRNYVSDLLSVMVEHLRDIEFVAFTGPGTRDLVPRAAQFRQIETRVPASLRSVRIAYENTLLGLRSRRERLSCMHWFANSAAIINAVPAVVTVYDLMVFSRPGDFSALRRLYLQYMIRRSAHSAAFLAPISSTTASDIRSRFKSIRGNMGVIPPVLHERFRPRAGQELDAFRTKHDLPEKYWLYVAHFYPHKNHRRLLQAYRSLVDRRDGAWPLVPAWRPEGTGRRDTHTGRITGPVGSSALAICGLQRRRDAATV